jgi:hypothetical protein
MQEQNGTKALANMKNEDEKNEDEFFFWIEAKKNEYGRTLTIEATKKEKN